MGNDERKAKDNAKRTNSRQNGKLLDRLSEHPLIQYNKHQGVIEIRAIGYPRCPRERGITENCRK